jgi:hypothetical protein
MTPPPLRDAIEAFNTAVLNTLLEQAGVGVAPKTKGERVEAWGRLLTDAKRIREQYERLPSVMRRALDLLRESGGELSQARYESLLVKAGLTQARPARDLSGRAQPPQKPGLLEYGAIREHLLRAGLIWSYSALDPRTNSLRLDLGGGYWVYVPAEVERRLPPIRERIRVIASPEIKTTLPGSARTLQRDLYLMWSATREQPLALTNAGLLRASDLKRVARQLLVPETIGPGAREPDFRRIVFLRQMLTALGLIRLIPDQTALEVAETAAFLSLPPTERVARCFATWREANWWNELWATTVTAPGRGPGSLTAPAPAGVAQARLKVIRLLAAFARRQAESSRAGGWVSMEALSETLRDQDEGFLVDRSANFGQIHGSYASSSWNLLYDQTPYLYNQLGWSWDLGFADSDSAWNRIERVFIEAVIAEGLHWLGLVDLGFDEEPTPGRGADSGQPRLRLVAARLTDMGRWLLLDGPQPVVPIETGRVVLQPNYRIFAFDPISEAVLARMDSFATRLNAERAIEYELNQASVYRAQLAGQSVAEIKSWLEQVTGAALPQNVSRSLDEWGAAFERIVVRQRVGWVEAASPELADALAADPEIAPALIRRVSPTGFLVQPDQVAAVEQALLTRDETPARYSQPSLVAGAVRIEPDGAIRSVMTVPNLFVRAELSLFADWDGAAWRVTPSSAARARLRGLEPAAILKTLRTAAGAPLPAGLEAQIKAWSRHYGSATAQTLTLVRFQDQETLDELLRDPALRRLMEPYARTARLGLATADPNRLEELVAALVARGVEVITAQEPPSAGAK